MMQIAVDPEYPLQALDDCGMHLGMVVDFLSNGSADGIDLSDQGAAGLADLLRAVMQAMDAVSSRVREVYPAGLRLMENETGRVIPGTPAADRAARRALLARLPAEDDGGDDAPPDSASAGAATSTSPPGGASPSGAGREPAPRLVEPRPATSRRRAA